MSRRPGAQCQVFGCGATSTHDFLLGSIEHEGDEVDALIDYDFPHAGPVRVCTDHAAQFGTCTSVGDRRWVVTDERAVVGWKIVLELRPAGKYAIVLYPPSIVDPERARAEAEAKQKREHAGKHAGQRRAR